MAGRIFYDWTTTGDPPPVVGPNSTSEEVMHAILRRTRKMACREPSEMKARFAISVIKVIIGRVSPGPKHALTRNFRLGHHQ